MTKIVLTRQLPPEGAQLLKKYCQERNLKLTEWKEDRAADRAWLLSNMKDSAGILCMLNDKVDSELLSIAKPSLKVVSSYSAGFDHVDLSYLRDNGIRLGVTPDALTDAVADLSVWLALGASRLAGVAMRKVLDNQWPSMPWSPLLLTGQTFKQKTFGFLGFGRIAQATLLRMLPYDPSKVIYTTSQIGKPTTNDYYSLLSNSKIPIEPAASIDQLAKDSDVLFVCCALTTETKNLVDAQFLGKMKSTAVIVNTARGPIIDSDALARALKDEKLLGAGLDVLTGEPNIPADHPLVKEPRAIVLPHIGSAEISTRNLMAVQAVENLMAGLANEKMVSEKML